MQTIRITETTPLFAKRVCSKAIAGQKDTKFAVCVSSLMIDEIKRIIKDSEIVKYVQVLMCLHPYESNLS